MNKLTVTAVTVVAVLAMGLSGCTRVQQGMAAGGALGGVAGAVAGHNLGSMTAATVVGTGAGAATGGLAGDAYEYTTDQDMKREMENLRAQLDAAEDELALLRDKGISSEVAAQIDELQSELEATRADLQLTEDQLATRTIALEEANGELAMARSRLTEREADMAQLSSDLSTTENELETVRRSLTDKQLQAEKLAAKAQQADQLRADLTTKSEKLEEAQTALADMDTQFSAVSTELETTRAERDEAAQRLALVKEELASTRERLDVVQTSLREKEATVDSMRAELSELNVELEETSRGLTLTIVDQLLFNAGSAELSADGEELISQVAAIIQDNFPGRELMIEGHTDNQPITHSHWKSNWELGSARALSVLHALAGSHGFDPAKLSATTYGEFRPAAPNATDEGRAANRRSVIVILPEKMPIERNIYAGL